MRAGVICVITFSIATSALTAFSIFASLISIPEYPRILTAFSLSLVASISRSSNISSTFLKAFLMLSPMSYLGIVIIVSYERSAFKNSDFALLESSATSFNVGVFSENATSPTTDNGAVLTCSIAITVCLNTSSLSVSSSSYFLISTSSLSIKNGA